MTIKPTPTKTLTEPEWLAKGPFGEIPKTLAEFEALASQAEEDLKKPLDPSTFVRVVMGRPKKGEDPAPSKTKTVRLPLTLLEEIQAQAEAEGISFNALLRAAAAEYLSRHRGA
jgi:predicted DNA binding CopG/RHH family protein